VWIASIRDQDLLYQHLRADAALRRFFQQYADSAALHGKRGNALPGVYIYSEEQ
jgi:hypothetical protein